MIETVAVLMPTKGRTEQMRANVTGLLECLVPAGAELVVVLSVCLDDEASIAAAQELSKDSRVTFTIRPADSTAVYGWNLAHQMIPAADWFVLGADDIQWAGNWLNEALHTARATGAQVIGLNDGHTALNHYAPHYMVHRDFIKGQLGGFMAPPEYKSWWFDREVCERARALGVYAPAWHSYAIHLHPDWNTAPDDATYQAGKPYHDADRALYQQRMGKA